MSRPTSHTSSHRDLNALFASYLAGDSLAEIGRREGVSGERIRQLFREAGYPPLQSAHTNRQRSQQRRAELREPLIAAYRELHTVTSAAERVGCSVSVASQVLKEAGVDLNASASSESSRSKPKVSAEFCRQVLAEAADRLDGAISESRYQDLIRAGATTDGRRWPWPSTVLARLGVRTWNEALASAGVRFPSGGSGTRGVGDDELVGLARDLQQQLGRLPTQTEFAEVARTRGLPGIQSIRRRFGNWAGFVNEASAGDLSGELPSA